MEIIIVEKPENNKFKDLENQKFSRLFVIGYAGKFGSKRKRNFWYCKCDCGQIIKAESSHLLSNHTQSCGCLQKERTGDSRRIHGMTESPENNSYRAAKERCNLESHIHYKNYGGRGIKFKFKDFVEFYEEVGEKPEPKENYTIERINNNGHYEKGNVRWATYAEQGKNRRNTKAE